MGALIFVPLEQLTQRYSAQWYLWFTRAFEREGMEYQVVPGCQTTDGISTGEFLDVFDTNAFKSVQTTQLVHLLSDESLRSQHEPITVFFMDAWHPAIPVLAYLRDCAHLKIRITGMLHAGSYDPHDFLHRMGTSHWARPFERAIIEAMDTVFLASHFHANLIKDALGSFPHGKFCFVDWPCATRESLEMPPVPKERLVVWPHRDAPEKDIGLALAIESMMRLQGFTDIQFRYTAREKLSKGQYYQLLNRATVVLSTAKQETFGIAMQEGIALGCIPVAPKALCYPEVIPSEYLFDTPAHAAHLIARAFYEGLTPPAPCYNTDLSWVRRITEQ